MEGWQNHDSEVDITKRLPYEDNTVDFILIEHCLEHVNCADGFGFLAESHRILKPGGILRVCVPAALMMEDTGHAIDLIVGHGHQMIYDEDTLGRMIFLAGFEIILPSSRKDCDQHWKTIGKEKDDMETLRMEAVK